MTAYVVFAQDCQGGDNYCVGVFFNKEKCEKYIEENNEDERKERAQIAKCEGCYRNDFAENCENKLIKTDRHGEYCENGMYGYHAASADWYYYEEKNFLDEDDDK